MQSLILESMPKVSFYSWSKNKFLTFSLEKPSRASQHCCALILVSLVLHRKSLDSSSARPFGLLTSLVYSQQFFDWDVCPSHQGSLLQQILLSYSYRGDQHFLSHSLDITRALVRKVQTQSGPTESAHPAASLGDSRGFQAGTTLRPAPFFLSKCCLFDSPHSSAQVYCRPLLWHCLSFSTSPRDFPVFLFLYHA